MLRREVLSLATALVSLLPGLAIAQDNTTPPPAPPPAAETAAPAAAPAASAEGDQSKEKTEEIVVTGSRVRRKDLNTPAPVTVISKETIQASGKVSIGDFLQTLPEQGNAINTSVNNGGDGATRVSLRGIGSARTLVLINGRRMVPGGAGADASVDLNSIPTAAIERVEILKDGASAIYGSDAIAGVVNLITRKKWSGTEFSAFGGVSGHSDAATTDLSITTGTSGDRGNLMFSAGFYDQQRAMAGDRSFSKFQYFYDATGDNNAAGIVGQYASGSSRVPGGRVSATGTGDAAFTALQTGWFGSTAAAKGFFMHDSSIPASDPHIAGCLGAGRSLSDCQWRPMNTTNTAGLGGDLYNFAPINYLVTPQRRVSLFSTGDTNFGSLARGFFEASYVNRQSKQQLAPEPLIIGAGGVTDPGGNLVAISRNNMYNPFGKDFTSSSRRLDEFGPRTHDEDIDTIRVVGGLDGTLGDQLGLLKGWAWDASLNYGRTSGTFIIGGSLQSSRVADALGPSTLVNGKPACVRDIANPAATVIAGCVPLDLFHGSGSITQDQVAPLIFTGTSRGTNAMTAVNANVSGELFSLFADRPVGLAVGYEYRNLSGSFTNDPLTAKFDSSNGGSFDTKGSYQANEGYAELSVPILSGMPLVNNLEASAAVRVFHYSNFGNDSTYKFGARYSPIRDVTVRGTYSTAFRAPSIPDLFSGQFDNFPNVHDPCRSGVDPNSDLGKRCGVAINNNDDSTQLRSRNGGNPDLKPETAKIYTVGVVYEPSFLRNFSATLDYYNVDVNKAITTIGESTILAGCYSTGNQPQYCDLVIRDPISHQVTLINNLNQNVGEETVAGIDLALRYTQPTAAFGRFGFTFDGTWLQKHNQVLADGTVVKGKGTFDLQQNTGQGGTNAPYKFRAGVVWGLGGLGAGAAMKYISGFHECGDSGGDFSGGGLCYVDPTFQRSVDAYQTYDVFVSYALASGIGRSSVAVGVNNVFDTNPVKIYNGFASATDQYNYDQIGRFFYVRLTHNY